jgi:hypothetical protein
MNIAIDIDMDPILSRLDIIVESREADMTGVNERLEGIEETLTAQVSIQETQLVNMQAQNENLMLANVVLITAFVLFAIVGLMRFLWYHYIQVWI